LIIGNGYILCLPPRSSVPADNNEERLPTSDESVSGDWSGTPGSRYQAINDYPDIAPTDYLEHGTVAGDICFGFSPFSVPAGATILCVQVWAFDSEPVAGTNRWTARVKVGGSYYNSSNEVYPSTGLYHRKTSRFSLNPRTGVAWTADDVNGVGGNALQAFGVRSADANPVFRISSMRLQVVYEVAYSGAAYVDIDADPGYESAYVPPSIGDTIYDDETTTKEAIIVPFDSTQQYYLYPSPSERVYHATADVQVGDYISNEYPGDAWDVVTEVGDGWFKSVAGIGYEKMVFVAGQTIQRVRGPAWVFFEVVPWLPTLVESRILKYNVRIMSLEGELFEVAGYEQLYRRKVRMKLLLRELVEDAIP
jgi:hypothetical protein